MPKSIVESQKKSARVSKQSERQDEHGLKLAEEIGAAASAMADPLRANPRSLRQLNHLAGNQATHALIQTKLRVGDADDEYEREADRKADEILAAEKSNANENEQPLQLKAAAHASSAGEGAGDDFEERLRGEIGGGTSLPSELRSSFQERFDTDLSKVRIHQGSNAEQLNNEVNAKAFTHGRDIFFNAGQYQPNSAAGRHLLAHELTHVVQQNGAAPLGIQRKQPVMTEEEKKKYYSSEYKAEKILGYGEHEGVGLGMAGLDAVGTVTGLAANDESATQNDHDKRAGNASTGLGIISSVGSTALAGVGLAKSGLTYHRGRMLGKISNNAAAGLMGRRLRRRGRLGMVQSSFGVAGGITGIVSGGLGFGDKTGGASSHLGGAAAAVGTASSAIGVGATSYSIHNANKKVAAAGDFLKKGSVDVQETDPNDPNNKITKQVVHSEESKAIAQQIQKSQGRGRKTVGLLSGLMGGASGVFGMAKGFGNLTGVKGDAVGGVGFALGFGGSLLGGIGGLIAKYGMNKDLKSSQAKLAELDNKISIANGEIQKLTDDLASFENNIKNAKANLDELAKDIVDLEAQYKKDEEDKTLKASLDAKKQAAVQGEGELTKLEQGRDTLSSMLRNAEDNLKQLNTEMEQFTKANLNVNPELAARYICNHIEKDPSVEALARDVLKIEDPKGLVKSDPELAQSIIQEKLNKIA